MKVLKFIILLPFRIIFWPITVLKIITKPSKEYIDCFYRFKENCEKAGFKLEGKATAFIGGGRGFVYANNTQIKYSVRRKGWGTVNYENFNGYYYDGYYISVFIMQPCSEQNKADLETVIDILKNSQ